MKRDRTRTEVVSTLLQLIAELSGKEELSHPISIKVFAEKAGLSRQALHKSHADVVNVLQLINKGFTPKPLIATDILERNEVLKAKCTELEKQLAGAVEQNNNLIMVQKRLEKQLASRGLSLVHTTTT